MTRRQIWFALLALALGGFGIGATEFASMGLLPEITRDLLPNLYAIHPDQALGKSSLLITSYAVGVVLGAPLLAVLTAKISYRAALVGFAASFTVFTVVSALAPTFEIALIARFLAAVPHGAYFGVAPIVAATIMGPGKRGQGVAIVLSGLTVANLLGVPVVTALGQVMSWRIAFLAIAGIFAAATLAIFFTLPPEKDHAVRSPRAELKIFRRSKVWMLAIFASIALTGYFALYSYVSPMVTELAGLPLTWVAWVLAAIGLGMTIGNLVGGRLADLNTTLVLLIGLPSYAIAFVSSSLLPSIQVLLMDAAHGAPALGGAIVHSAFNIGNALGAALGGSVVALGLGFRSPTFVAAVTTLIAFVMFVVMRRRAGYKKAA